MTLGRRGRQLRMPTKLLRICRKKITRAEAQLETNTAAAVKDNKKVSTNTVSIQQKKD